MMGTAISLIREGSELRGDVKDRRISSVNADTLYISSAQPPIRLTTGFLCILRISGSSNNTINS